jgi:hypothetical protein
MKVIRYMVGKGVGAAELALIQDVNRNLHRTAEKLLTKYGCLRDQRT